MRRAASPPPLHDVGSMPRYELRVCYHGPDDTEIEVWQVPAPVTPHLKAPQQIAGLRGRNLALVERSTMRMRIESRIGGVQCDVQCAPRFR